MKNVTPIEPWLERVIKEKAELDKKILALITFTGTEQFNELLYVQRERLITQREIMLQYSDILRERIRTAH